MKILWHSNAPWAQTGYGQQTALFAPRLRALGHELALSSVWGLGGAGLEWEGMHVYPQDDRWGRATLNHFADMPRGGHFGAFEVPELYVADVRECFRKVR